MEMKTYISDVNYINSAIEVITDSEKEFKGGMCKLEAQISYLSSIKCESTEDNNEVKRVLESLLKFRNECLLDYIYNERSHHSIDMPKFLIRKI